MAHSGLAIRTHNRARALNTPRAARRTDTQPTKIRTSTYKLELSLIPAMKYRFAALLLVALAQSVNAQTTSPPVTRTEFRQLSWLVGTWRGSGGAYAAFFEEYRLVNDSTIRMRAFKDSTLRVATDSSFIELRNGALKQRGSSAYRAPEFSPTSVHFVKEGATSGGFTFTKKTADLWTATLHPGSPQGKATVYEMRRIAK